MIQLPQRASCHFSSVDPVLSSYTAAVHTVESAAKISPKDAFHRISPQIHSIYSIRKRATPKH